MFLNDWCDTLSLVLIWQSHSLSPPRRQKIIHLNCSSCNDQQEISSRYYLYCQSFKVNNFSFFSNLSHREFISHCLTNFCADILKYWLRCFWMIHVTHLASFFIKKLTLCRQHKDKNTFPPWNDHASRGNLLSLFFVMSIVQSQRRSLWNFSQLFLWGKISMIALEFRLLVSDISSIYIKARMLSLKYTTKCAFISTWSMTVMIIFHWCRI